MVNFSVYLNRHVFVMKASETSNKGKTNPVKRGKQKPRNSRKNKNKHVGRVNNQAQTYPSSGSATNSRPTENKKTVRAVKPTKSKTNQNDTVIDLTTQTEKNILNKEILSPKTANPSAADKRRIMQKPLRGGTRRPIFRLQFLSL